MSRRKRSQPANGKPSKKVVSVTDLTDMGTQTITVIIERGEEELHIPLRTLTYGEWYTIGREVVDPSPPDIMSGPSGKVYDYQDPAWKRGMKDAMEKRGLLRLIAALQVKGITGDTNEAKIECLFNAMDTQVIHALMAVLEEVHLDKQARIETRANSFQPA